MTAFSVLDLAPVVEGSDVASSLEACVTLAQRAESLGYTRVWYAEHHNMPAIASAATSVLIAHVAAHTSTIRLGAAGVMLPNHSPLVIAEQFGTLASLHPKRIDLGVGRAPGTDQLTMVALRRPPDASLRFPEDVQELQGYFADTSLVPGVSAIPGRGTHVPIFILGSSLFGAQLAAQLGLPFGFASHFAPAALEQAITIYRDRFQPSTQLEQPYLMAGLNAIAVDDGEHAQTLFAQARRAWARRILRGVGNLSDDALDGALTGDAGRAVDERFRWIACGDAATAQRATSAFAAHTGADEVIVVPVAPDQQARVQTLALVRPEASR